MTIPTPGAVEAITRVADPVSRNLQITECYGRLSVAMRTRVPAAANWTSFATWASRQAGHTIRGEDFSDNLERRCGLAGAASAPAKVLWRMLVRRGLFNRSSTLGDLVARIPGPLDAFERASDAVARGNRKVFAEIGLVFARYLAECPPGADSAALARFLDSLAPGPAPEGQDLLRAAFTRYHQQESEADANRRAQLVLLANLEIGLHEQTRLQPEIQEAMQSALPHAGDVVQDLTRDVVTECLMTLRFPRGRVLALGANLNMPFPASLQSVTLPDLSSLLARFEPPAGIADDCGAEDWASLNQRLHYIIHLFRAFQERPEIFDEPFSPGQATAIQAGQIPEGDL